MTMEEQSLVPPQVSVTSTDELVPVSVVDGLLQQPDWKTASDDGFLAAAQSVFVKNTTLLQRLA
jgi:hypothetical protein